MTQSGQGYDPQNSAAGPAREGVVLPANGEPWAADQQAAPPAGQPWGQPWGPDQQPPQAPPYGQGPAQGQQLPQGGQGHLPVPHQPAAQSAGLPYEQQPGQGYGQDYGRTPMPPAAPAHDAPQQPAQGAQTPAAQQLPPQQPFPGQQPAPSQGQGFPAPPQGQPQMPPMPQGRPPLPPQAPQHQAPQPQQHQTPQPQPPQYQAPQSNAPHQQAPQPPQAPAPLPPAAADAEETALIPPFGAQEAHGGQTYGGQQAPGGAPQPQYGQPSQASSGELVPATPQAGAPLPPAVGDAEATALLPPIGGAPGGHQSGGHQPGGPGGAAMPPQTPERPESPGESTTMLRRIKPPQAQHHQGQHQQGPPPQGSAPGQPMPAAGADDGSEATQLIPPVGAGTPAPPPGAPFGIRPGAPADRPTPAEFDGLFRADSGPVASGAAAAPDATAQLPRFDAQGQAPYGQQGRSTVPPQGGGQVPRPPYDDGDGGGRRRLGPVVIIGALVVALAGAGLGVGYALSGGDEESPKKPEAGSSAKSGPAEKATPTPAADPAKEQATKLDALLADSNDSRAAVIGAVKSIRGCDNLGKAAKDLKAAAAQRNDLVTRLQALSVDKIPDHAQLTAALTTAWKSSASADTHYAAWAGQVGGKKGCHKGHARNTQETAKGNAASGTATKAKNRAAQLWNPIAKKYGLTEHRSDEL